MLCEDRVYPNLRSLRARNRPRERSMDTGQRYFSWLSSSLKHPLCTSDCSNDTQAYICVVCFRHSAFPTAARFIDNKSLSVYRGRYIRIPVEGAGCLISGVPMAIKQLSISY